MNMMDKSRMRRGIEGGTALAALAMGFLVPAHVAAQSAQAQTAAEPAVASGEIVVTAQRREQKLNDVGIYSWFWVFAPLWASDAITMLTSTFELRRCYNMQSIGHT